MKLCFDLDSSSSLDILLGTLPSVIFIMEVAINFNTSYYEEGLIHEERSKIIQHYIRGDFLWDLVVILPY
jgi:potassium voltage-gated channel Eag-related subfamily H protein 5